MDALTDKLDALSDVAHLCGTGLPGGEPCEEDDCGCDLTWLIPDDRPGSVALTVWDLQKAAARYRAAAERREATHAD